MGTLNFLPENHIAGFDVYMRTLMPSQASPVSVFFSGFLALFANIEAVLAALTRPPRLIAQITTLRREIERNHSALQRPSRWPLGLLDDTRQRATEEREDKIRRARDEAENLSRELRYTQQTVASELAGWRDMHEKMGRKAIRDLARGMLIAERVRLSGMERALRKVREGVPDDDASSPEAETTGSDYENVNENGEAAAAVDSAEQGEEEGEPSTTLGGSLLQGETNGNGLVGEQINHNGVGHSSSPPLLDDEEEGEISEASGGPP